MLTIYRIEHTKGPGPYRYSGVPDIVKATLERHNDRRSSPTPANDRVMTKKYYGHPEWADNELGRDDRRKLRYGFESLESLLKWFTASDLRVLSENGFIIATYRVKDKHVFKYKHQCVFVRPGVKTRRVITHVGLHG